MKEHKKEKEETITVSKTTLWQIVSVVLAVLLIVSIFSGGFSKWSSGAGNKVVVKNDAPTGNNDAPADVEVNLEGAHSIGSDNAPVVMVEWSDFQCPFCARFYSQTEGQLIENYVNAGKLRIVYKHFPLDSIHPMATPAALASECAAEQGKFWEYHDLVFQNYDVLSTENLKKWAADLSLDTNKFNTCLDSEKYMDKVKTDLQEGLSAGIRGTPGFILDGQLISGAQPYDVFASAIDAALE